MVLGSTYVRVGDTGVQTFLVLIGKGGRGESLQEHALQFY